MIDPSLIIEPGMDFNGPIYYSGKIKVNSPAFDPIFGATVTEYPILQRVVEVYSWHETKNVRTERRGN